MQNIYIWILIFLQLQPWTTFFFHFFLGISSLLRKSSSMRGRPSRNLTFGSQPSNSLAFVISGFLCRGSSGVFSTVIIFTSGLMSCRITHKFSYHGGKCSLVQSARLSKSMKLECLPLSHSPQVQALWIHLMIEHQISNDRDTLSKI